MPVRTPAPTAPGRQTHPRRRTTPAMKPPPWLLSVPVALLAAFPALAARAPGADPATVRAAIEKAIPPIERSAAEYARQRTCFSCHHQALPLLALSRARGRGYRVDAELLASQ